MEKISIDYSLIVEAESFAANDIHDVNEVVCYYQNYVEFLNKPRFINKRNYIISWFNYYERVLRAFVANKKIGNSLSMRDVKNSIALPTEKIDEVKSG